MPTANLDDGELRRFPAFHAYADDAPRTGDDDEPAQDWRSHGRATFDEEPDAPQEAEAARPRRAGPALLLIAGLWLAAFFVGAKFPWLHAAAPRPLGQAPAVAPPAPAITPSRPAVLAAAPPAAEDVGALRVTPPRRIAALNCARAEALGARRICRDPRLLAADRSLARAYAAAARAGVPYARLRRARLDWLSLRDNAARYPGPAVEEIYRQRVQDLRTAILNEPPH